MRVYIISIFAAVVTLVKAQNLCTTPRKEPGKCVLDTSCSIHVTFMNSPNRPTRKELNYLKRSICSKKDDEVYVCCSNRHILSKQPDIIEHPAIDLLRGQECGQTAQSHIAGGVNADLAEFPWAALLQYKSPDGLIFECGGSLISKRHILTAAHCVTGTQHPIVSVRLGEHDTSKAEDCEDDYCLPPVQDIPVERIWAHEQYQRKGLVNDIAVIRLSKDANLDSDSIQPVCLPITKSLQDTLPKNMIIVGWGITENDIVKPKLQKAEIPVRSDEDCQELYENLNSGVMCAGGSGSGQCSGDSGGSMFHTGEYPNFKDSSTIRMVQYGVISSGVPLCYKMLEYPGVQVRVAHYITWILDKMT